MKLFSIKALIALLVLSATAVYAQHDMSSMQMQAVQGIASTSDANRHYLLHLASLNSPSVAGATAPSDTAVAISTAQEFNTWFQNAIQGFNDVQATVTDSAAQQSRLADFLSQRDAQVSYYMGQLNAKLSPSGKTQVARYIAATIPGMQSGVNEQAYNNMKASLAATAGDSGTGLYQCSGHPGYTCNVTYSLASAVNNSGSGIITNPASGTWHTISGTITDTSNTLQVTNGGSGGTAWGYENSFSPYMTDQLSQIKLTVLPSSGQVFGTATRVNTSQVWPSGSWYGAAFYNNGSGYSIVIQKVVAGTGTNVAFYNYSMAAGDLLGIEAQGTTISVFLNGDTIYQYTDSSLSQGSPGIYGSAGSAKGIDWTAGAPGLTVQINPIIDGTESMNGNPPGVFHQPTTWLSIGGVQQNQLGSSVCTSCYIYGSGTFYDGLLEGGTPPVVSDGAILTCTQGGQFFNTNPDGGYIEPASTFVQNLDTNHSQGGAVFTNGPDGAYEWETPNGLFLPESLDSSPRIWQQFTTAPYVGYAYKVQNWCSNTSTPDADFTNFKVVLPEVLLSGGTWGGRTILAQGNTMRLTVPLWRTSTTSQWSVNPWFSPLEVLFGIAGNNPWNSPISVIWPQLNAITGKQACTVTGTGTYKVNITPGLSGGGTACIEHNNQARTDNNIVPCAH